MFFRRILSHRQCRRWVHDFFVFLQESQTASVLFRIEKILDERGAMHETASKYAQEVFLHLLHLSLMFSILIQAWIQSTLRGCMAILSRRYLPVSYVRVFERDVSVSPLRCNHSVYVLQKVFDH